LTFIEKLRWNKEQISRFQIDFNQTHIHQIWHSVTIFLFLKLNKAEGKVVRHYFEHPESFDRDYFDHLKGRLSAKFFKAIL